MAAAGELGPGRGLGTHWKYYVSGADHVAPQFAQGESVTVWANKVGPFNNPQEYYMYFSLPYCRPDKAVGTMESLGESISGYELRQTKTDLRFGGADSLAADTS